MLSYKIKGLLIGSALSVISFLIMFVFWNAGDYGALTYDSFMLFYEDKGVFFVFLLVCFFSGLYIILAVFRRWSTRRDVLYLLRSDVENENELIFVDRKGNKYFYFNTENGLYENGYYEVAISSKLIYKICGKANASFEIKEKKSYWLNFYSPMGNIEDFPTLPIFYILLVPSVYFFITSEGGDKLYGILTGWFPLYLIIYDIVYKIKKW